MSHKKSNCSCHNKSNGCRKNICNNFGNNCCITPPPPNGICLPYNIKLFAEGSTRKIFYVCDTKAYFIINAATECLVTSPITTDKCGQFLIKTLNNYTIKLTTYPEGCPMANLPIYLEVVNPTPTLDLNIVSIGNTITVNGVMPEGLILRFYTDSLLLKYFTCVQVVGNLEVGSSACELNNITKQDANTRVQYVSTRPPLLSLLPPIPFPPPGENPVLPGQFPNADSVYPWTQGTIPHELNQPPPEGTDILPPLPIPPIPPLIDSYGYKYNKFRSVPDSIIYYLGYNPNTVSPTQEDWTLFLRNFDDRGYAEENGITINDPDAWQITNWAKKQYMNAFTTDKLQFYIEKIDSFVTAAFGKIVANKKPLTSAFQESLIQFFLEIHIGIHVYPQEVVDYFDNFIRFIGIGDPNNAERNELVIKGNLAASKVFDYFNLKATESLQNEDKSTIAYWWGLAGLSPKSLLFECVHNIVAFSQFTNVIYSVIYTQLNPTNPLNPALPNYPNFLQLYVDASSGDDKLNVVREAYRLLVPNSNSFSRVETGIPGSPPSIQARHLHQQIMIQNNPGADLAQLVEYFTYNPDQYVPDFSANYDSIVGLPVSNDFTDILQTSARDQETVVQVCTNITPIFPRPTYAPFGLGYRRCAGEIFVYFVTEKLFEQFSKASYMFKPGDFPTVYVAPFKGVPDNIFAVPL